MNAFVVEDIVLYEDIFCGRSKYFLTSEERGKYIKLSKQQYDFYKIALPLLKKTDDRDFLKQELDEKFDDETSLEKIEETFWHHNLLAESHKERKGTVEVEFTSNKVCEIPLHDFQRKHKRMLSILYKMMMLSSMMVIIGTIFLILIRGGIGISMAQFSQMNQKASNDLFSMNLLLIFPGFVMSMVLHELGHLLTADHYGIEWKNFNFAMRWGINFVYYIKYRNFYANSSVNKLRVTLSGVFMNLVQACFYYSCFVYFERIEFGVLLVVNMIGIINNLLPKGASDGYHAFGIITGLEGIRWRMLKTISILLNNPKKIKEVLKDYSNLLLMGYFIGSYAMSLWGCYKVLISTNNYLEMIGSSKVSMYLVYGTSLFIIFSVLSNIFKLYKNVKGMVQD